MRRGGPGGRVGRAMLRGVGGGERERGGGGCGWVARRWGGGGVPPGSAFSWLFLWGPLAGPWMLVLRFLVGRKIKGPGGGPPPPPAAARLTLASQSRSA